MTTVMADWERRIGRRVRLRDLHILSTVVQWGSMAKAANQLAVSHPVISRSISDLEHTLGVRLLERNPRGVELTAYGRAMLKRSHAAFDELRQGIKDIADILQREGVIDQPYVFMGGVFAMKARDELKYGEYQFHRQASTLISTALVGGVTTRT